ncbi:MAG: DNA-directed RNA polymerase [Monoraphidium minutum]|nr:MAG: DNA-directed RNA polymerase [Monoraphidium minutum]
MNQPDRYERFVLPEHLKKLEYVADTKLENAGTYTIEREDHTLGNLVRMQLHRDPAVLFSGYRIPHPLEPRMLIKVQTTGAVAVGARRSDADKSPQDAFVHALKALQGEFSEIAGKMADELARVERETAADAMGGGGGGGHY